MHHPSELRPAPPPRQVCSVVEARYPSPAFSRFLYSTVGADWHWTDRLGWSPDDWQDYLDSGRVRTWVLWRAGTPAGYIELCRNDDDIEIAYFGLLPGHFGHGFGGHLLTAGLRAAWAWDARRVWVHTCSLDGPAALANYEARGLRRYRSEPGEKWLMPRNDPWTASVAPPR